MKHVSGKFPEPAGPVPLTATANHLNVLQIQKNRNRWLHRGFKVHGLRKQLLIGKICHYDYLRWSTCHYQHHLGSPHFRTLFLALTCRKILSSLTGLFKVHVGNPWAYVPFSVQIHILSKGGDRCLSFNKAPGDVVGSISYSTAPQLREIRDKYCPEKT